MKKTGILLLLLSGMANAQPGAMQISQLIYMPAALSYERGTLESDLSMYSNGGLLTSLTIGITNRFNIGISYGGENIIGTGDVNLNPQPCVQIRYMMYPVCYGLIIVGCNEYLHPLREDVWQNYALRYEVLHSF